MQQRTFRFGIRRMAGLALMGALVLPVAVAQEAAPEQPQQLEERAKPGTFRSAAERDRLGIDQRVNRVVRVLKRNAALTPAQEAQFRPLLTDYLQSVLDTQTRYANLDKEAARVRRGNDAQAAKQDLLADLADVLDVEQIQAFKELQKKSRMRGLMAREPK